MPDDLPSKLDHGASLARQLAEHVSDMGAASHSQTVEVDGRRWVVTVAIEGPEAPSGQGMQPYLGED